MKTFLWLILWAGVLAGLLGAGSAAAQSLPVPPVRTALVMGVWDYHDPMFPALPSEGIRADLSRMDAKLKALGFQVTVVENPTLGQAKKAVDTFGEALRTRGGASLFYFSGHGAEHDGRNYLVPTGTSIVDAADLDGEALVANRVLNRIESGGLKVNMIFLDCCRSAVTKAGGDAGLAAMAAKGALIGFATRSGDVADTTAAGSPYTTALLANLDRPGVSLPDMHTLVTREMERAGSRHRPGQYVDLGEIYHLVPAQPTLGGLVGGLPGTSGQVLNPSSTAWPGGITTFSIAVPQPASGPAPAGASPPQMPPNQLLEALVERMRKDSEAAGNGGTGSTGAMPAEASASPQANEAFAEMLRGIMRQEGKPGAVPSGTFDHPFFTEKLPPAAPEETARKSPFDDPFFTEKIFPAAPGESPSRSIEDFYATPVPGKPGWVYPPRKEHKPENEVDVSGRARGSIMSAPGTGIYLVP